MLIKVRVFTNSKKEEIIKKRKDSFVIKVKEKPIEGRANDRIISLLAFYFHIPRERIRLIKGGKMRNKIFDIS